MSELHDDGVLFLALMDGVAMRYITRGKHA